MTRIIAGELGGRRLETPKGRTTRPTTDRTREALFNTLAGLIDLDGARVADLYAGSGAIGFEAASRGAGHVLLVDLDPRTARANRRTLGLDEVVEVVGAPVERVVAKPPSQPYDLVFADPPYDLDGTALAGVLAGLAGNGWLAADAVLVVERASRSPEPAWPDVVTVDRGRRYGEATLWYGRRS